MKRRVNLREEISFEDNFHKLEGHVISLMQHISVTGMIKDACFVPIGTGISNVFH